MARKTEADPTGLRDKRKRTGNLLAKRLSTAQQQVITLFNNIPRNRIIVNQVIYEYDITPEQLEDLHIRIRQIIDDTLETTDERIPSNWWYKLQVEQPTRQGTVEEINNFNRLITVAITLGLSTKNGMPPQKLPVEVLLNSRPYLTELRRVYVENYGQIKSLSTRIADQVIQQINFGIRAKLTPSAIAEKISERFNVGVSSAKRIANTEINKAYNNARLETVDIASNQTGLRAGVVHVSALLPTSRPTHMARHGNVYTTAEQRLWWDTGSNRINCYCTTTGVLVNSAGEQIIY